MASSVEDKVKQIIVEQLGVDESEVTPVDLDENLTRCVIQAHLIVALTLPGDLAPDLGKSELNKFPY